MNEADDYKYPSLVDELPSMIAKGRAHAWLQFEDAQVYCRVSDRIAWDVRSRMQHRDQRMLCVQVATVICAKPRTGTFTRMIAAIEGLTDLPIMLENVMEREWANALVARHGWLLGQDRGVQLDLWRFKEVTSA